MSNECFFIDKREKEKGGGVFYFYLYILETIWDVSTMFLCIPSSFGSIPRAIPTSCGICKTGIEKFSFSVFSACFWFASKLIWHNGHGVVMQSAWFSFASLRFSAVRVSEFSFEGQNAWNPQHSSLLSPIIGVAPNVVISFSMESGFSGVS